MNNCKYDLSKDSVNLNSSFTYSYHPPNTSIPVVTRTSPLKILGFHIRAHKLETADLLKSQLNLYFYNICSFYYLNNHMVSSQIMFNKTYQICSFYFCWELSGYNLWVMISFFLGFPGGSEGKTSVYNVGDLGSIPGSGRSPGEGNGKPLQYSCLENPMDWEAW